MKNMSILLRLTALPSEKKCIKTNMVRVTRILVQISVCYSYSKSHLIWICTLRFQSYWVSNEGLRIHARHILST